MVDWDEIVAAHGLLVWRTAYRLLGRYDDALDCCQETFLAAYRAESQAPVDDWPAFLASLTTRRAIDQLRRRVRSRGRCSSLDDAPDPTVRGSSPIDHKVMRYKFHWTAAEKAGKPSEMAGTVFVDLVHPRSRFEAEPQPYGNGASLLQVTVHDRRTGATLNESSVSRRVVGNDGKARIEIQPLFMTHFAPVGHDDSTWTLRPVWDDIMPFTGIAAKTPFLDALRAMEARQETTSAKVPLDGRVVAKFSAKAGTTTYTVWVDPQTKLPLRIENAFPDSSRGGSISRLVCTEFAWDPQVADIEACFRAEPPARAAAKKGDKTGP